MFTVYLYSFTKNEKSTARPASAGTGYDCQLKEACSILSPLIVLDLGMTTSPYNYNYAYIPDFGRYYYIQDWTFEGPLVVAHMVVDALATYKTEIGNTPLYVLRSSVLSNGYITDDYYPTKTDKTVTHVAPTWITNPFVGSLTSGYYVVGVINNDSGAVGAVSYYVFTNTQLRSLCAALMAQTTWLGTITDVTEDFLKALYNPFEYIVSCMWFPLAPPLGSAVSDLPYGWYTLTGVSCRRLGNSATSFFNLDFTLPSHPQISRGTYLNTAPFRRLTLHLPFIGDMPIDTTNFVNVSTLGIYGTVDFLTGDTVVQLCRGTSASFSASNRVALYTGNVGIQIQLAQVAVDRLAQTETVVGATANLVRDVGGMLSSAGSGVGNILGALQKGNIGGLIGSGISAAGSGISNAGTLVGDLTHGIADSVRASLPQMFTRGANGSIVWTQIDINMTVEFFPIVDEDLAHTGRPLCAMRTPASLGGFLLIKTGDVPLPGTAIEAEAVRSYLESGFYFE